MQQLTENFRLSEFLRSNTAEQLGIDNCHPVASVVANLGHLCRSILQPLRDHHGHPITVTSGYRCPALNRAVGGALRSQHLTGQAADLRIPAFITRDDTGNVVHRQKMDVAHDWMAFIAGHTDFDQLILEHSRGGQYWIHVSCRPEGQSGRRQIIWDMEK